MAVGSLKLAALPERGRIDGRGLRVKERTGSEEGSMGLKE